MRVIKILICNILITGNIVVKMDDIYRTVIRKNEGIIASSEAEDCNFVGNGE